MVDNVSTLKWMLIECDDGCLLIMTENDYKESKPSGIILSYEIINLGWALKEAYEYLVEGKKKQPLNRFKITKITDEPLCALLSVGYGGRIYEGPKGEGGIQFMKIKKTFTEEEIRVALKRYASRGENDMTGSVVELSTAGGSFTATVETDFACLDVLDDPMERERYIAYIEKKKAEKNTGPVIQICQKPHVRNDPLSVRLQAGVELCVDEIARDRDLLLKNGSKVDDISIEVIICGSDIKIMGMPVRFIVDEQGGNQKCPTD